MTSINRKEIEHNQNTGVIVLGGFHLRQMQPLHCPLEGEGRRGEGRGGEEREEREGEGVNSLVKAKYIYM